MLRQRVLLIVGTLVFVDTMLYSALAPLLPRLADSLSLSKTRAGTLVAAYAIGALIGALPGGVAATRLGARRAIVAGLLAMAVASAGFGFAGGFWELLAARILQGCASAFTWSGAFAWLLAAAPRDRRGEWVGAALGAAVFGALFGPVVGALAAVVGRQGVFGALAVLSIGLALATIGLETLPVEQTIKGAFAKALRNHHFASGLRLMVLGSFLLGTISVLAPLHLAAAGWGAVAIGGTWFCGAAIEAVEAPLVGRMADRRGSSIPVRVALGLGAVVSFGLAAGFRPLLYAPLVVLATASYGALFTPAFTLIANGAETVGLSQGVAFGLMSASWALGGLVGPAMSGAIANATADWIPFVIGGIVAGVAFAAAWSGRADDHAPALSAGLD